MKKLGFTFYPQDWWGSDTFLDLPPELRYIYLELISKLYMENNSWKVTQVRILKLFGVDVGEEGFRILSNYFNVDTNGYWSLQSIGKRLSKAQASRENGKLGGRPRKTQKPNLKTYENPPLEREREREIEIEIESEKEFNSPLLKLKSNSIQFELLKKQFYSLENIEEYLEACSNSIETNDQSRNWQEWTERVLFGRFKKYLNSVHNNLKHKPSSTSKSLTEKLKDIDEWQT